MPDTTFLSRVAIKNYKSIVGCDVRLGPLTFLIGPNGAGKSNYLDALNFVKDGLEHSLDFAIQQRGGFHKLCHGSRRLENEIMVALEMHLPTQGVASYSFRLRSKQTASDNWRWEVSEERCQVGAVFFHVKNGEVRSSTGTSSAPSSDRLFLVLASGQSPFREVFDALGDMQFYHLQPRSIPDIDTSDLQHRLRPDGSNLASVLSVLQFQAPGTKARIDGFLRVVLPTLFKVSVEGVFVQHADNYADQSGRKIALVFQQKIADTVALFGPTQMSEGTLRTLAILTALYQIDFLHQRRPSLTAIEDVEAAVHPAELAVFFDALQEASLTTQVIVTSQSPDLLDRSDVQPDSILAVSAEDGITRIGPLDDACKLALEEQHLTVGELLRIGQAAPRRDKPSSLAAMDSSR